MEILTKLRFPAVFSALIALAGVPAAGDARAADIAHGGGLKLASAHALVVDLADGRPVFEMGSSAVTPIASVTKLMTAMVALDAGKPLDAEVTVGPDDIDALKGSRSRLQLGVTLTRREMLRLALMSSENRAASALARDYPGGTPAFVAAMNRKAAVLGMASTRFVEATGLSSENVSTAVDLAKMVKAAASYPLIREFTTQSSHYVEMAPTGRVLGFNNSNPLVASDRWDIQVSKTGFIREAGKCLVLLATIASRPVVIVLLDSFGRHSRVADATRVKHWLETGEVLPLVAKKVAKARRPTVSARAFKAKGRAISSGPVRAKARR